MKKVNDMSSKNYCSFTEALVKVDQCFDSPAEILSSTKFSDEQKLELLEQWKSDIKELLVADDENMLSESGAENNTKVLDTLKEVNSALEQLQKSFKKSTLQ